MEVMVRLVFHILNTLLLYYLLAQHLGVDELVRVVPEVPTSEHGPLDYA